MLLNPDVVYAGVNPYKHYIECGHREGRSYSASSLNTSSFVIDDAGRNLIEVHESFRSAGNGKRKIIFHIGGSKTGSSALQNFFESNFEALQECGFAYENRLNIRSDYEITSGNGYYIFDLLKHKEVSDTQLDCAVLSYLGRSVSGICSSEFLSSLGRKEWLRIHQSCTRLNIDYDIIIYIRSPASFFYSAYNQIIKRHGGCESFYEFSQSFPWMHLDALRTLHDFIDCERIMVFYYDAIGQNIASHFLGILGIGNRINPGVPKKVNRSLTSLELNFLRGLNKCLSRYSRIFSDHLIYLRPNIEISKSCEDFVVSELWHRFERDVEWVNKTFFGADIIKALNCEGEAKNSSNQRKFSEGSTDEAVKTVKSLCERISDMSRFDQIQQRVSTFSSTISNLAVPINNIDKEVPHDFNPISYLLLNPDIVFAGENAYVHFMRYGKDEDRCYSLYDNNYVVNEDLIYDDFVVSHPIGVICATQSDLFVDTNSKFILGVSITNFGPESWSRGLFRSINISYHWLDSEWNMVVYEGLRTSLPEGGVRSQETVTADLSVIATSVEGKHYLVVSLVQEYEGWFDEMDGEFKPAIISITVIKPSFI
jgi:hypothetical protein